MDDPKTPNPDDLKDKDTGADDLGTPADTNPEGEDDPKKKAAAEEAANEQEKSWLEDIKSGERELKDMPENLGWLKERVKKKLESPEKEEQPDRKSEIREALAEERAEEEFGFLIEDLESAEIPAETEAQLKEAYEEYLEEFKKPTTIQKVKALKFARKVVGLKDNKTFKSERKRRGMSLPPLGGKKRATINPDKKSEMETKFGKDLPPGFKA